MLASGTLTSTKGTAVAAFERAFAKTIGARHAIACSSGTAAIHAAVAALDLEPGDEIVTTPITDMGALAPILYQAAIPVFADVDPATLNCTAQTIAAAISERTRAIVVTHLFGNPAEIAEIAELAAARGIPLIEDCAQAFLATYDGRFAGRWGAMGCFSLQQGKHVTCGEGGIVVTDDDAHARRVRLFVNKGWGYGDPAPDHYFLALNYRMTELQGAVAGAQLAKLRENVAIRRARAAELDEALRGIDGLSTPLVSPRAGATYWKYAVRVDAEIFPDGPRGLASLMRESNVAAAPRYIVKPAFACEVFAKRRTFGTSQFPFTLARPEALDYRPERFPGTYAGLAGVLVLPLNERYTGAHVARVAAVVRDAAARLRGVAS